MFVSDVATFFDRTLGGRRFTSPLAALVIISIIAACTSREDSRPQIVQITAQDYSFDAPDTVTAGWITFRLINQGSQPHMGELIHLSEGVSVDSFLTAYTEAFHTVGARPGWATRLGGPTVAAPQQTTNATMHLDPGRYVWICLYNMPDGVPHVVSHSMARPFFVKGSDANVPAPHAPKADVDVTLLDYAFGLSGPLTAGSRTIRVKNEGTEAHEVTMLKLAPTKRIEDVRAWLQNPMSAPMETIVTVAGGVTSFAPGREVYFDADLTSGNYVLLCLVTAPDGRSHMEHGMIQQIRVE